MSDLDEMVAACEGVDAIIHLGGISKEAPFEEILDTNVRGSYSILEAAHRQGVPRVVLASSNHAVGYYLRDDSPPEGLPADLPPRPDSYYGWSKAAMESLRRLYVDTYGMDVFCVRIGSCFVEPFDVRMLTTWMSPDDGARLMEACLSTEQGGFRLVWGVSPNTRMWWSLAAGEEIGFHPVDDSEVFADKLIAQFGPADPEELLHRLVGGKFCFVPTRRANDSRSPGPTIDRSTYDVLRPSGQFAQHLQLCPVGQPEVVQMQFVGAGRDDRPRMLQDGPEVGRRQHRHVRADRNPPRRQPSGVGDRRVGGRDGRPGRYQNGVHRPGRCHSDTTASADTAGDGPVAQGSGCPCRVILASGTHRRQVHRKLCRARSFWLAYRVDSSAAASSLPITSLHGRIGGLRTVLHRQQCRPQSADHRPPESRPAAVHACWQPSQQHTDRIRWAAGP